jgi:hypothetical protein
MAVTFGSIRHPSSLIADKRMMSSLAMNAPAADAEGEHEEQQGEGGGGCDKKMQCLSDAS